MGTHTLAPHTVTHEIFGQQLCARWCGGASEVRADRAAAPFKNVNLEEEETQMGSSSSLD